jgi:SAM-dependent methyltransferase
LDAPFPASSFNVITGFHVLEHVHQPKEVIGKLWEWLKPGGVLYLQVPNIESLDARIFQSYWYGLELPRHLFHFSPVSLRRLIASFGFDEVLLRTMPYTHAEVSMPYVFDELRAKIGFSTTPHNAVAGPPGMAWRIVRKALRLGFLNPLGSLAAVMGRGAGIEAVFRKRPS